MLYRCNLVLGFALAVVFVMLIAMRVDHSKPNYQVNLGDDMTYSPAYGSYELNGNFPNGRTQQPPVPGTIARGEQLFHFQPTPEDAIRAGVELVNPFDLTTEEGAASADRGAAVFRTFCVTCHGADGAGNGPVAQRGFPPPPSLLIGKSRDMKDGQLLHILTYGQSTMPQFAAQLSPARRWDVINYIRVLQQKAESEKKKAESGEPRAESEEATVEQEAPPTEEAPAEPELEAPAEEKPETAPEPQQEETPPAEVEKEIAQPDSVVPAKTETEP